MKIFLKCDGRDETLKRRKEGQNHSRRPNIPMKECPEIEKEAKTPKVRTGASATEGASHGAGQCLGGQLVKAWHPGRSGWGWSGGAGNFQGVARASGGGSKSGGIRWLDNKGQTRRQENRAVNILRKVLFFLSFFDCTQQHLILVLQPGIKPVPLEWKCRVLTTGLPEKSPGR